MEQLKFEVSPMPGRRCKWNYIYDKRIKAVDNPKVCEFVAETEGCLCQKHVLIKQMMSNDLFFDGNS
jgi:hypothetical protein